MMEAVRSDDYISGLWRAKLLVQTYLDHGAVLTVDDAAKCMAAAVCEVLLDRSADQGIPEKLEGFCYGVVIGMQGAAWHGLWREHDSGNRVQFGGEGSGNGGKGNA